MPELGQTLDPAELVPGRPDAISRDLRALVDTIERVAKVGDERVEALARAALA
jgi:hypothetical protein